MKEAAADSNRHRVGPIVGTQLVHKILNVEVHCCLRNVQSPGNFLVAVPVPNEAENLQFPRGENVFPHVLRETSSHVRRNVLVAGMNGTNDGYDFSSRCAFEQVGRSARSQSALDLTIAIGCSEHDEARLGKLTANGDEQIGAIDAWKPEIHQRDVGPMAAKFDDRLFGIGCLGDQKHVGLRPDNRRQAFTKDGMILNAKDTNSFIAGHRNRSLYPRRRPSLPQKGNRHRLS